MARSDGHARRFAGSSLRALRKRLGLGQAAMAVRLGLSVSYLSQLENDTRPITAKVADLLARSFPFDWSPPDRNAATQRTDALRQVFSDPLFADLAPAAQIGRIAEQQPDLVDRLVRLHAAWQRGEEARHIADEALASGVQGGGRLPWEEVRDWFHDAGNYVDPIDRAAEELAEDLSPFVPSEVEGRVSASLDTNGEEKTLIWRLRNDHHVDVLSTDGDAPDRPMRQFDASRGLLTLDRALPGETRRFLLAQQLGSLAFADTIAAVIAAADVSEEARRLLGLGLANYVAGALLMPYARFRTTARAMRHDIDRLCSRFGVSFEQACHRLSNLQRPGARGIPFFFCRVDMAGNITKRHSATRLQFARFGGACPLWIVHEAVAIPDRILVQLAETPDGVRYVSMAKGLVKPSGSYVRAPRRYAVALGCEVEHADAFIYADGLDLGKASGATPIGISCRLCPRPDCDQRAFPPADRLIATDAGSRATSPYRLP